MMDLVLNNPQLLIFHKTKPNYLPYGYGYIVGPKELFNLTMTTGLGEGKF